MEHLGWIAIALMGMTLGLIGGGGSILTVPIFAYLFHISATMATGYSLFVVGATALVGSIAYMRRGLVDFKTAATFAPPAFLGVYLARRYVVPAIPETVLQVGGFALGRDQAILTLFAVLMLASAVTMIRKSRTPEAEPEGEPHFAWGKILLEGLVVGGLTGLVGAGGGFLIIPALVLFANVPMQVAVGTSLLIIAAKSLLGFLGDVQRTSDINWTFLVEATLVAAVGIVVGSLLASRVSNEKLKPAFGWFLVVMGAYILGKELH